MTTQALSFEEQAFNKQKDSLASLIHNSREESVSLMMSGSSLFLSDFHSKVLSYIKACRCIWGLLSPEYFFFTELIGLVCDQRLSSDPLHFSDYTSLLLKEVKK